MTPCTTNSTWLAAPLGVCLLSQPTQGVGGSSCTLRQGALLYFRAVRCAAGIWSQSSPGPGVTVVPVATSRSRNGPIRCPSWAECRNSVVPVHGVHHAPPGAGPGEVPRGLQVGHDGLHGALGQADDRADVPDAGLGVAGDLHQDVPVAGQQRPDTAAFGQGRSCSLSIQLARGSARDRSHEIFLALYIDFRSPEGRSWECPGRAAPPAERGRSHGQHPRGFPARARRCGPSLCQPRGNRRGARSHRRCADA